MPMRETTPPGAPCWVDLMTSDPARSREFYAQLLGWVAEDPAEEFGGYFDFTRAGVRVAGCMAAQPGGQPSDIWSVYLATDDIEAALDATVAHAGEVHVPAMPVGDLGTMAFVADPGGAGVGLWQPGLHTGFGITGEPGAPSWFELITHDYDAALAFYRAVFGWRTQVVSDTGELRYTTVLAVGADQDPDGESWLAGVMDAAALPAEVPSAWSVYLGVGDTDDAVATVARLGGQVLVPAEDSSCGRIATVADPNGARFLVVAANEDMPAER